MASRTRISSGDILAALCTAPLLLELAGRIAYDRGVNYFRSDAVHGIGERNGVVTATVSGSIAYTVKLWEQNGSIGFSCNCLEDYEGNFCKHCVATALAWADVSRKLPPTIDMEVVGAMLRSMPHEELVLLLLQQADQDPGLRRTLGRMAMGNAPLDTDALRETIDQATDYIGRITRVRSYEYAENVARITGDLKELANRGANPAAVAELVQYTIQRVQMALANADDSAGYIDRALDRLHEIHFDICSMGGVPPRQLAEQLLVLELASPVEVFYRAYETYAGMLGSEGRARYRELALAQWNTLAAIRPGDPPDASRRRTALTAIMETIARHSNDQRDHLNAKVKDRSTIHRYRIIINACREAKAHDQLLEFAVEAVQYFPGNGYPDLFDAVIFEYKRRKDYTKALEYAWERLRNYPGFDSYTILISCAKKLGAPEQWRDKAIALFNAMVASGENTVVNGRIIRTRDGSVLVKIFLSENDHESAWQTALALGCSNLLWLDLAEARRAGYPEDTLSIYETQIADLGEEAIPENYRAIVSLLHKMQPVMDALGRHDDFEEYLGELRKTWARRANFIKMLDEAFPRSGSKAAGNLPPETPATARRRGRPAGGGPPQ